MSVFLSPPGPTSTWRPRRLKPLHLLALRLYFQGMSQTEVAARLGISDSLVSNIVNSEDASHIMALFHTKTLDTILDVQTDAQAMAPAALEEKLRLMTQSRDDRVRNTAATDILNIAGHVPVSRVQIEATRDPIAEKNIGKSDEELRQELLASLAAETVGDSTLH